MTVRLSPIQYEVVNHGDGAILVVAGPGSGKTRVLTERVRRLLSLPDEYFRILALTFTNKAANEMVARLADFPDIRQRAFIGTLHSFCMEVLANRGKPVGVDGLPSIFESYDDRKQVLQNAVQADPRLSTLMDTNRGVKEQQQTLSRWLSRIGDLKNALVFPDMVDDLDERLLYEAYNAELRASGALDYDDLLLLTYRLFEERPSIADLYRRQYRYICLDEAQDVNEAQYRLLKSLCGNEYKNVMFVGDPKQAIYVWNGADPKYMNLFERDYHAKTITLTENYRCSEAVVRAAQRLNPSYAVEGQLPIKGEAKGLACENEEREADAVVSKIRHLMAEGHPDIEGPISLGRIAVLARNRYVFGALETKLEDLSENELPFCRRFSAAAYQSESAIMRQFELSVRLLSNPRDRLHLEMLAKAWGIAASDIENLPSEPLALLGTLADNAKSGCAASVRAAIVALKWSMDNCDLASALARIEADSSVLDDDAKALVLQDCADWMKHWDVFLRSEPGGSHSISSFLAQVALGATQPPTGDVLSLLTVHSAKGLEFDVVFLIGMNDGTFPDFRAKGSSLDEELRSAFVAVTRSKRLLYVTYPKLKRMPWGDIRAQRPSPYIAKLFPS